MRKLSLDQLTVIGVTQPELIAIASETGYEAVSPIVMGAADFPMPIHTLEKGSALVQETAAKLRDTGLAINIMDGFPLLPHFDRERYRTALEVSASLGAKNAVTLLFDPDTQRSFDRFCALAEDALHVGMHLLIEFTPLSQVPSLEAAIDVLTRSRQPNVGLQVDLLHLAQSGGSPADLKSVDPTLIRSAQICDGPAHPTHEQYAYNALNERTIPGEGELPVREFLAALPPGVTVGVEVPLKSLADAGVPHRERARRLLQATRALLDPSATPEEASRAR